MNSDQTYSISMLDISASIMGRMDTIHPTLIRDSDHTILIDTGYPVSCHCLLRHSSG
ncbi:hypothetical protein [Paenibacillus pini]|uniref:hypothetical protein n=1 Tax=Paenibacillus pini TaxID=669461 RepID=UPI0026C790ED|nr:hypothetical protein [Paenibacillus pini]